MSHSASVGMAMVAQQLVSRQGWQIDGPLSFSAKERGGTEVSWFSQFKCMVTLYESIGGVRVSDLHPDWPIITGVLNQHQACNNISASVIPLAIKAFTRLRFCVWCLLWFLRPAWWRAFSLFHWKCASLLTLCSRCGITAQNCSQAQSVYISPRSP